MKNKITISITGLAMVLVPVAISASHLYSIDISSSALSIKSYLGSHLNTLTAIVRSPSDIPEPATMFLFGLGLICISGLWSRKFNK